MQIIYRSEAAIKIDFSTLLEQRGITNADITEATFMVKEKDTDLDEDAIIDLRLGSGLTWAADNTTLLAIIPDSEWDKSEVERSYTYGIGYKVASSTRFVETLIKDRVFRVTQDFIRE